MTTPGIWVLASRALGRPVTTTDTYPHVCGSILPGRHNDIRLYTRDCGACQAERQAERAVPAPLTDEAAALAAAVDQRRTGDRE